MASNCFQMKQTCFMGHSNKILPSQAHPCEMKRNHRRWKRRKKNCCSSSNKFLRYLLKTIKEVPSNCTHFVFRSCFRFSFLCRFSQQTKKKIQAKYIFYDHLYLACLLLLLPLLPLLLLFVCCLQISVPNSPKWSKHHIEARVKVK